MDVGEPIVAKNEIPLSKLYRVVVDFAAPDGALELMDILQGLGHTPCLVYYTDKFVAKAAEIKARTNKKEEEG
ncbi:MAG: hypothetical protein LBT22_08890 [Peptococcaceae bacterium]|jgi:hypothetical protein|nr:hypothetical protein [Peptococcaceae bacterium]